MEIKELLARLTKVEEEIVSIKNELAKTARPFRLAFVNFFAGGKSYAYTADDSINEGDLVMVPTASRGDIPGVVVYTANYAEEELPFHNTKTVIGKLEDQAIAIPEVIAMTAALAPAIADKERAKANIIAYIARRTAPPPQEEELPWDGSNDNNGATGDPDVDSNGLALDDDEELEGDGAMNSPQAEAAEEDAAATA